MTDNKKFEILFFELQGRCPVQEFLNSLDDKSAAKLYGLMGVLEDVGNALREPYSKPLGDDIFELRTKTATGALRILYFFCVGHKIIMTNGFVKKTQKTPAGELALAKKYRKLYLEMMDK